MKLTVPVIPYVFSNLFETGSISRNHIQFAKGNKFNCTFISSRVQTEKDTVIQKTLFQVLNHDKIIYAAGIRNSKNYRLLNDFGQKFFRTLTFKTSVKLPSLTTGICFVRVKFKVTGEATYLQCLKIKLSRLHSLPQK